MTSQRKKPTHSSVTNVSCKCGWLERAADEPVNPVYFDAKMREYQLRHSDGGYSLLYHCPWCGGAAPPSRRSSFFAVVPSAEWNRLAELTSGVKTVEQALRKLGPADEGEPLGLTIYPAAGGEPPRAEGYRTLTFSTVSKVANVVLNDFGPRGVSFSFHAKGLAQTRPQRRSQTRRALRKKSR